MTMLARLEDEGIFRVTLSPNREFALFEDRAIARNCHGLDKKDMDELIVELTELRNNMKYGGREDEDGDEKEDTNS